MPPKKQLPAPIDRPVSRAYLREFTGWSTAYPPGLSDPTSLRVMENLMINRDGSCRVRPGLRYLSYVSGSPLTILGKQVVGSHEVFFLNSGERAYLFAVRNASDVGFMVAKYTPELNPPFQCYPLTDPAIGFTVPQTEAVLNFTSNTTYVKYVQIDNKIVALSDAGEEMRVFYVGATKTAKKITGITEPTWGTADKLSVVHPDMTERPPTATAGAPVPVTAEAPTASAGGTLISATAADNDYNFGFFYSFNNEIGESAPSQVTVIKAQRGWSQWAWQKPNVDGSPNPADPTAIPTECADQLVASMPSTVYNDAKAQGALSWNLYMLTWSDQQPVPVEAVLVGTKVFEVGGTYANEGWQILTPQSSAIEFTAPLPTATTTNYSIPSKASQGLVAADRLVLVHDPLDPAKIRWSSNNQGDYLNFSSSKGGGFKTLTSGNLMIPASVKLWQNPQSVDTLTILCQGVDGHSTGYYMQPAQVASQSDATNIMGFEETTATPGTTSPYGCEVMNNALYHPLDEQLMKSTASNYNINHKSQTDQIENGWNLLAGKEWIVSSQHDSRLYLIVNNPQGAELESGCKGNEIWVLDTAATNGTWSRWLIQACSLRKVEVQGRIHMSVVRPDGIFYLDPEYRQDDYVSGATVGQRVIPWRLESNTQGANRAHDAWCRLQQVQITLGNWVGKIRWGVRGRDLYGRDVELSKVTQVAGQDNSFLPDNHHDQLLTRTDIQEWFFYAESVGGEAGTGQINLVQYRYTPVSVNVGYEYGSVETFEYGRAGLPAAERTTDNGVPNRFNTQPSRS